MIHVTRPLPGPPSLDPERTSAARAVAESFFAGLPPNWRAQRRFEFDASVWLQPDVFQALRDVFGQKCAFCESPVSWDPHRHIHHFRPTSNARDKFRDEVSAEHYWWLAYEWENLYLACDVCARSKADQFPIGAKARPPAEATGPMLESERPLLLDPCLDDPADYLEFREDGRVYSRDGDDPRTSRGEATIFVFGLNREELVRQRKALVVRLKHSRALIKVEGSSPQQQVFSLHNNDAVDDWFDPRLPFVGVRRALFSSIALPPSAVSPPYTPLRLVGIRNAAVRRGWDVSWIDAYQRPPDAPSTATATPQATGEAAQPDAAPPRRRAIRAARPTAGRTRARRTPVLLRNTSVTEVTITNFRSIRELTLTLDREVKAQEQAQSGAAQSTPALNVASVKPDEREWRVLLGENGAGKSSVVQALCLALAGKAHVEEARKLGYFDPADVLRVAPTGKRQPKQGSVTVRLTDSTITLTFGRKGFDFTAGAEGAGTFLRAYGATRLLPRGKGKRARGRRAVRIDNLFDPFTPLHNADEWIAGLWREVLGARGHADDASAALDEARSAAEASRSLAREARDPRPALAAAEARRIATLERRLETWTKKARFAEDRFNAVALALKDLLRLDADSTVKVAEDGKTVVVDDGVFQMPIRKLSDGYQTVIALAVDIMAGIPTRETDFRNTAGIVLLDELGTHLHPRWRMEIVGSLRRTFAHMQFIATTHEPLCLRGLREGEIAVMRRDDDEVTLLTDLPAPDTMRVDQLLTSRFFGLHTTIDPDVDRDFQAYYDLLARRGPVSPPDEQGKLRPDELEALKKLRKKLEPHRVLGYTRRDQLVAEVIDEYFAGERTATRAAADTMRADAKERIAQIWRRVRSVSEAAP